MTRFFSGPACRSLPRSKRVIREGHPTFRWSSLEVGELCFFRDIGAARERERAQVKYAVEREARSKLAASGMVFDERKEV
jgi:hypothetical protein